MRTRQITKVLIPRRGLGTALAVFILLAVMVLAVLPIRSYLEQQNQLTSLQQHISQINKQQKALQSKVKELKTNQAVINLARKDYGLVKKGQQAYVITNQNKSS